LMDTDRFYETLSREHSLLRRRPWYVLTALLLLLCALTRQPVVFFAAGFTLVLAVLPEWWYRVALRHLRIAHHLSLEQACFGEQVTLSLHVENHKWLPLPWVEVEDEIPAIVELLNGSAAPTYKPERKLMINACSLWSFQRVTRRYHLRCLQRGAHVFGPTTVRSSDPFGWLVREERLEIRTTLLVYPLLAPLSAFGLPARFPFGERTAPQRLLEDPLRVAGVRAYQWGDEPRRIHWKASARTGIVQSKQYEPATQHRLFLFLETRTFLESWLGIDPDLQEFTISAAASIAQWALEEGYLVGLATNSFAPASSPADLRRQRSFVAHARVPMARGTRQQARLLETLGRLVTYFSLPLAEVIEAERASLPYGTTVLLISPARTLVAETVQCLLGVRRQGMAVQLALTGEQEQTLPPSTDMFPVHWLGGKEVWHELLQASAGTHEASEANAGLHVD
jgi:uncharacterized protein (DUF58 family)